MEVFVGIVIGMVVSILVGGSIPSKRVGIQPLKVSPKLIGKPPNRGSSVVKERSVKDHGI